MHQQSHKLAVSTNRGVILIKTLAGYSELNSRFFAEDTEVKCMSYVPDNCLVIADGTKVVVYDVSDDNPVKRCSIETESPVISIMTAAKKDHCALLQESGKITIHNIENKNEE